MARKNRYAVITRAKAQRHEALFVAVTVLHRDVSAIAAKKPQAPVGEGVRVVAESLLSDCVPFGDRSGSRLVVAAPDFGGLAVQLGLALAQLDVFETRLTFWNGEQNCRCWRVEQGTLPLQRLRQPINDGTITSSKDQELRKKLVKRLKQHNWGEYERGFAAGRAARIGPQLEHRTYETYQRTLVRG